MNMKKEYRAELKTLCAHERKVHRDLDKFERDCARQIQGVERQIVRARRNTKSALARIQRRQMILCGRLS
jgi:hypothetical protein